MQTMSKQKKLSAPVKKTVKRAVQQPQQVTDQDHLAAIEVMKEKCYELRFTIGRLPTSRKADRQQAEAIAKLVKGSRKGVRTSWRMFLDDHPSIKELNAALNVLQNYRDAFAKVEDSKKAGKSDDDDSKGSKQEAGKRLILADDHKDVYDQIKVYADRVADLADKVQAALPEIKANDKKEAGDLWNEAAYPTDVRAIVGVPKDTEGHYIVDFEPTVKVPPGLHDEIKSVLVKRAEQKLSGSLEVAVESAVKELNKGLATFMSELVNRVRIYPVSTHDLHKLCEHGQPEVIRTKTSAQDSKIPPGQVMIYIQYKGLVEGVKTYSSPDDLEWKKGWFGPYTESEYATKIKPQATEETKKIYPTVIEGLISRMQAFREKQKDLLGVHGGNVDGAFTALFDTLNELRRLGDDNRNVGEKVAHKLKLDEDYKQLIAETIGETIEALDNSVTEVKKVRRRISKKLIGDV